MLDAVYSELQARRAQIRARWEALLRIEQLTTPLANPDVLVRMFDRTLDEIFQAVRGHSYAHPGAKPEYQPDGNPFRHYYIAAEQVLMEALVLVQAGQRGLNPIERDAEAAELQAAVRAIAARDIGAFSGLSQRPPAMPGGLTTEKSGT